MEAERKQAQDMLNHSEKVWQSDVEADVCSLSAFNYFLMVFFDVAKSCVLPLNRSCAKLVN